MSGITFDMRVTYPLNVFLSPIILRKGGTTGNHVCFITNAVAKPTAKAGANPKAYTCTIRNPHGGGPTVLVQAKPKAASHAMIKKQSRHTCRVRTQSAAGKKQPRTKGRTKLYIIVVRPNCPQTDIIADQAKHSFSLQRILATAPSSLVEVSGYTNDAVNVSVVDGKGIKAKTAGRTPHTGIAVPLQQDVQALGGEAYTALLAEAVRAPTAANLIAAIVAKGGTTTAQKSDGNFTKNMRQRVLTVLEDLADTSKKDAATKWGVTGFQPHNAGASFSKPKHRELLQEIAGRRDDPGLPGSKPSLISFKPRNPTDELPSMISFVVDVPKYADKGTNVCDISDGIHRAGWYVLGRDAN